MTLKTNRLSVPMRQLVNRRDSFGVRPLFFQRVCLHSLEKRRKNYACSALRETEESLGNL